MNSRTAIYLGNSMATVVIIIVPLPSPPPC